MKSPLARASRSQPTSPYKGLAPFDDSELDVLLFFGRERERAVITANLVATRVTVLYGASGVGKSSVLRAAVKPSLAALPEHPLVVYHDTWSGDPSDALAGSIAAASGIEPRSLSETLDLASARHGDVFVLLDQVEEYFTYHAGNEAMGAALAELATRTELPVRVLIGIREDALARLDGMKRQVPGLLANCLRLDHLSREAGREAIRGPVERFAALVPEEQALAIEPGLTDAVLDGIRAGALMSLARGQGAVKEAADQQRVEAPYLQVVMQRLWEVERAAGSRVLRLQTLEELGGPARIVQDHLALALGTLTPEQKVLAARMFNHLVTPSGTKIAHGDADLAGYAAVSEAELQPVLAALGRERILRPIGGDGGQQYEIFHDVLADAVLAWRGDFDANQALERERAEARRRHRRLIAAVVIALIALAAMTGIAGLRLGGAERRAAEVQEPQAPEGTTRSCRPTRPGTDARRRTRSKRIAVQETAKREGLATLKAECGAGERSALRAERRTGSGKPQSKPTSSAQHEAKRRDTDETQAGSNASACEWRQPSACARRRHSAARERAAALAAKREASPRGHARAAAKAAEQHPGRLVYRVAEPAREQSRAEPQLSPCRQSVVTRAPLVEGALRQALLATRGLRVLRGVGSVPVNGAAFSPDGGLLDHGGTGRTRACLRRHVLAVTSLTLRHGGSVTQRGVLARRPTRGHGRRRIIKPCSVEHVLRGQRRSRPRHRRAVTSAAFSPDGQSRRDHEQRSRTIVWQVDDRRRRRDVRPDEGCPRGRVQPGCDAAS